MNLLFSNDEPGIHAESWYRASVGPLVEYPTLSSDQQCDVCIIGGGYTGLSSALHMAQHGMRVVLLEAHRVGWGASGRNGGQVGSGYNLDQAYLEKTMGQDSAKALWAVTENAKKTVRLLIADHQIECDWKDGIIATSWKKRHAKDFVQHLTHLRDIYNYRNLRLLDKDEAKAMIGTKVYPTAVLDSGAGHLHPLKFAVGIANAATAAGAVIFENSEVVSIDEKQPATIKTSTGSVSAKQVVLACNGYLGTLDQSVATKVLPINNFMIATEPLPDNEILSADIAVYDSKFIVNYFRRSQDNRLLFGGGENYGYNFPKDITSVVRKPMLKVFPQLENTRIDYSWGGTLAITVNRLPCFMKPRDNVYSASGYSGHGVALATHAGKVISDAVTGNDREFQLLQSMPIHKFPGSSRYRSVLQRLAMFGGKLVDQLP